MLDSRTVAISRAEVTGYPAPPPFHPPRVFPEFEAHPWARQVDPRNSVYETVRNAFALLKLDKGRLGTPRWNPLGGVVQPGNRVLIKPNWVTQGHHLDGSWEQIITHGSVIRAVLDYVRLAMDGRGTISLADGPIQSADFDQILRPTGIREVQRHYEAWNDGIDLRVLD